MVDVTLHCGDCLVEMDKIADGSIALVFVDPPYNIGKATWDKINNYFEWCEQWIAKCSRKLKPNGAFWLVHREPLVLAKLSEMIASHGRGLVNWIVWDKYNGNPAHQACGGPMIGLTQVRALRSFQRMAEHLVYHVDKLLLAKKVTQMREQGKVTRSFIERNLGYGGSQGKGTGLCYRWEMGDSLPSLPDFCHASLVCRGRVVHQLDLSRYPNLRREYESLRYTFNNPGKVSSVWQIPPAQKTGHPTPKPVALLERIVNVTSNPDDIVLDPMMGGGTTGVACVNAGRSFTGIEINEGYFAIAEARIADARRRLALPRQLELEGT